MAKDPPQPSDQPFMTGLLTVAAIVGLLMLLSSAAHTGSQATPIDPHRRGPWGIFSWDRSVDRRLGPHERRWQTSILAARDNDGRWQDLVAELNRLDGSTQTQAAAPDGVPTTYDARWLEHRLRSLEQTLEQSNNPEEAV